MERKPATSHNRARGIAPKKILTENFTSFIQRCNMYYEEIIDGDKTEEYKNILLEFCTTAKLKQNVDSYVSWMNSQYARELIVSTIISCNGNLENIKNPYIQAWTCPSTYEIYKLFSRNIPNVNRKSHEYIRMLMEETSLSAEMCKKYVPRHWDDLKTLYLNNNFIKIVDFSSLKRNTFQSSTPLRTIHAEPQSELHTSTPQHVRFSNEFNKMSLSLIKLPDQHAEDIREQTSYKLPELSKMDEDITPPPREYYNEIELHQKDNPKAPVDTKHNSIIIRRINKFTYLKHNGITYGLRHNKKNEEVYRCLTKSCGRRIIVRNNKVYKFYGHKDTIHKNKEDHLFKYFNDERSLE